MVDGVSEQIASMGLDSGSLPIEFIPFFLNSSKQGSAENSNGGSSQLGLFLVRAVDLFQLFPRAFSPNIYHVDTMN